MGGICHITVTQGVFGDNITSTQRFAVDMRYIEDALAVLQNNLNPLAVVVDAQPFTETVYRFQQRWDNVYGAYYKTTNSLEVFKVVDHLEEEDKSKQDLRQVNINRHYALDALMVDIRAGKVGLLNQTHSYNLPSSTLTSDTDIEVFKYHMKEMKRIPREATGPNSPAQYRWEKASSQVEDHYHHSLLYAYIAAQITGAKSSRRGGLGPMFGSFKVR